MKLAEVLWGPEVWCQGSFTDGSRMCIGEAVQRTDACGELRDEHVDRLSQAIRRRDIISWNDDPDRTWDEVAAVVEEYDRLTMLEEG